MIELDYTKNSKTMSDNREYFLEVVKDYLSDENTKNIEPIINDYNVLYEFGLYVDKKVYHDLDDMTEEQRDTYTQKLDSLLENISNRKEYLIRNLVEERETPLPTLHKVEQQEINDCFYDVWTSPTQSVPYIMDGETLSKIQEISDIQQKIKIDMKNELKDRSLISGIGETLKSISKQYNFGDNETKSTKRPKV